LLVLRDGARLAASGLALGVVAGFALGRLVAAALFGVSPGDPLTYAGVAILQAFVTVAAALVPAWRATRVDPLKALRAE
jgi:ABC-type antimicrobial peptide transport system permease subunit